MRKVAATITLFVLMFLPMAPITADVVSDFDSSLDGWTGGDISHSSTGGNPDGYARFTDPDSFNSSVFAPSKFLGSWNNFASISFDHRVFEATNVNDTAFYEVEITGPTSSAIWISTSKPEGPDYTTPWVSHTVLIQESEWNVTGDWSNLISDVTQLRIKIELIIDSGTDIEGIDNVRLAVPEPSSFLLIMTSLAAVCSWRFRADRSARVPSG